LVCDARVLDGKEVMGTCLNNGGQGQGKGGGREDERDELERLADWEFKLGWDDEYDELSVARLRGITSDDQDGVARSGTRDGKWGIQSRRIKREPDEMRIVHWGDAT
jgi:hypothetical protein